MSDGPPKPNSSNSSDNTRSSATPPQGEAWQILEKAVLASVEEQRRARRWNIFFKLLAVQAWMERNLVW